MPDRIKVGMASWKLARGSDILITFGLGSCIGLGLWDPSTQTAAMAHIMLPDSRQIRYRQEVNPLKFADTAVDFMLEKFIQLEIPRERLQAKIVGGATMFRFAQKSSESHNNMNIGQRNVAAIKLSLQVAQVPLLGEDTGGSVGRSVEYYAKDGRMRIRTALSGEYEL